MRLKELFTVPTGQKVTEKALYRVLISSICSILLCMTCLVSTTWAWFTASIENTGNTIAIAEITASAEIQRGDTSIAPEDGIYTLTPGEKYEIRVGLDRGEPSADVNGMQPSVYVVMTVQKIEGALQCYYFTFTDQTELQTQIMTVNSDPVTVSFFSASWVKPANAEPAGGELVIGEAPAPEPGTEPTTEPSMEPSAPAPSAEETTAPEEINE